MFMYVQLIETSLTCTESAALFVCQFVGGAWQSNPPNPWPHYTSCFFSSLSYNTLVGFDAQDYSLVCNQFRILLEIQKGGKKQAEQKKKKTVKHMWFDPNMQRQQSSSQIGIYIIPNYLLLMIKKQNISNLGMSFKHSMTSLHWIFFNDKIFFKK